MKKKKKNKRRLLKAVGAVLSLAAAAAIGKLTTDGMGRLGPLLGCGSAKGEIRVAELRDNGHSVQVVFSDGSQASFPAERQLIHVEVIRQPDDDSLLLVTNSLGIDEQSTAFLTSGLGERLSDDLSFADLLRDQEAGARGRLDKVWKIAKVSASNLTADPGQEIAFLGQDSNGALGFLAVAPVRRTEAGKRTLNVSFLQLHNGTQQEWHLLDANGDGLNEVLLLGVANGVDKKLFFGPLEQAEPAKYWGVKSASLANPQLEGRYTSPFKDAKDAVPGGYHWYVLLGPYLNSPTVDLISHAGQRAVSLTMLPAGHRYIVRMNGTVDGELTHDYARAYPGQVIPAVLSLSEANEGVYGRWQPAPVPAAKRAWAAVFKQDPANATLPALLDAIVKAVE